MAGSWLWQSSHTNSHVYGNEAGAHCLYHYSLATQPVPPAPQTCYCSFHFTNTIGPGYAPMAAPYPSVSASCVGIPILKCRAIPCQSNLATGQPSQPGTRYLNPTPKSQSEQEPKNQVDENLDEYDRKAKRRCLSLSRPSQPFSTTNHKGYKPNQEGYKPTLDETMHDGPEGCEGRREHEENCQKMRLRRVTRRVGGKKTPQPYQRRKGTRSIQSHFLQIPGEKVCRAQATIEQKRQYNLASDYEEDVMKYMLEVEGRHHRPHRTYLDNHPTVTQRTRAILVDWIIQVQTYLGLRQETLYLTVALVDRVLTIRRVALHKLQLLAITALFIVAKVEETHLLKPMNLLQLTLDSYTLEELLALERQVLKVLEFELTYADPTVFLNYFLHLTCSEDDHMVVECAGFLLEVVMVERWPLLNRPSLLAAAAIHAATSTIHPAASAIHGPDSCGTLSAITLLMPEYFSLREEDIVSTSLRLLEALANRRNLPFKGVEDKYSSQTQHNTLALHPLLQPSNLLAVVEQVRTNLITLKGGTAVVITGKLITNSTDAANRAADKATTNGNEAVCLDDKEVVQQQPNVCSNNN